MNRAWRFLLLWCVGARSDAAPSTNLSTTSITGDQPSITAILVGVGNKSYNHKHTVLSKWADLGRESTANHLAVWVLCLKGSSTESSVRELPHLLPFVVEDNYSWARIIRDFSVQVKVQNARKEKYIPGSSTTVAIINRRGVPVCRKLHRLIKPTLPLWWKCSSINSSIV